MYVREIMSQPVVVGPAATCCEVAQRMLDQSVGAVVVIDGRGALCGLVSEADIAGRERCLPFSTERAPQVLGEWLPDEGIGALFDLPQHLTARDIMSTHVFTAAEDEPLTAAIVRMIHRNVSHLPVVRDGRPVGLLARRDVLRLIAHRCPITPPRATRAATGT